MKLKEVLFFFLEVAQIVAIALIIVVPVRYFIFQPFIVRGASMEPNFHDGDYLIVDELSYRFRTPERGEVVVFRYPQDPSQRFIKRIIGLPGEKITVKSDKIEVIDKFGQKLTLDESSYLTGNILSWATRGEIVLGQDEYFVLGDNRDHSFDSRKWGALKKDYIVGKALLRAWPPVALARFAAPEY